MSPVSIQTLAFISYFSPVHGRMAGASTSAYEFDSMVRSQHVYNVHGLHSLTKKRKCILWEDSKCDEYTVNDRL